MLELSNVIAAFTEDHVQRLTHLSKGRLRYWEKTKFFAPSYSDDGSRSRFNRIYSFKDVVALRTLEMLRVQNNVPLQHLRKVAEKLSHLKVDLWINTTLWVLNRKVVFQESGSDRPREILSGQYVLGIKLKRIIEDTARDAQLMRTRSSEEVGCVGKVRGVSKNVVVSGTRIRVDSIKRLHEDGYSIEKIIKEYPDLTKEDIRAAIKYNKPAA
jgi:DNA-binding transcriptional MerR regulator